MLNPQCWIRKNGMTGAPLPLCPSAITLPLHAVINYYGPHAKTNGYRDSCSGYCRLVNALRLQTAGARPVVFLSLKVCHYVEPVHQGIFYFRSVGVYISMFSIRSLSLTL